MKFTENAVEKAADDHGVTVSPSSLNRARFNYPRPYQRELEGMRFPGQLPPNFNGSYVSAFGNYRPHPSASADEPAKKPARQMNNPYAAGSSDSQVSFGVECTCR